jgi:hypothetical protein
MDDADRPTDDRTLHVLSCCGWNAGLCLLRAFELISSRISLRAMDLAAMWWKGLLYSAFVYALSFKLISHSRTVMSDESMNTCRCLAFFYPFYL